MTDDSDTIKQEPASEADEERSVDFTSFVLSLATNAIMSLEGDAQDGRVPGAKINLSVAAQHIDILAMLEIKTRGNLTDEEKAMLQSVLYDLRMHYLEAAQRAGKSG